MIDYLIDAQGIFTVKFSGPVSFLEIKEYLEKFKVIDKLPEHIRLLYDFQEGEINLAEDDLVNIAQLADEATLGFESVRTAFIVSKPDVTAFTFIFSQLKKNDRSIRRVFSTRDAAMNWLLSN
ncbi:MAG: hypothetical protein JW801_16915 [Bacteroidales bacterium]|nr:hypothetical protein [Bacteroidales bacterium]